jgi:glyoxylase-like metal-dependent hydrolase (beta-lactamase superfamily II)
MTLARSFDLGQLRCHALEAGTQHLDGGAMFGIVPKPLWERRTQPDSQNRIPLAMRCLLVEHGDGLILVDTGLGNKENEKFRSIYGVDNAGTTGPTQLEDAIRAAGHSPDDIRIVINTHLHFDHAGGNTFHPDPGGGEVQLTFPEATYVVQRGELEFAMHANERTAGSYLPHNFAPVSDRSAWRLVEGPAEVVPGIEVLPTPGHTPHHQSVLVRDGGDTLCFLADLVPTTAHLPLPWIMGYDLEPLVTLETKRALLKRAAEEGWMVVFEHDPVIGLGRVQRGAKSYELRELPR